MSWNDREQSEPFAPMRRRLQQRAMRLRHAAYYIEQAARADQHYLAGMQQEALAQFDHEKGQLDAVRTWLWAQPSTPDIDTLVWDEACATVYIEDLRDPVRTVRVPRWKRALIVAQQYNDRRGEGKALSNLGATCLELGEMRAAISYYEQYLAIAREMGDRRGEGTALGNLGKAYRDLGEARLAISYYEQHLAIAREVGDRYGEGFALGNLGGVYRALGEARLAIAYYKQDLTIAQEMSNRRGESFALGNLGNTYADLGEAHTAISYYTQCLAIAREVGDRRAEGMGQYNLGTVYADLGEIRTSMIYFEQFFQRLGDQRGESLIRTNLAEVARRQHALVESIIEAEHALKLSRTTEYRSGEVAALQVLGRTFHAQGNRDQAQQLLEQARDLAHSLGEQGQESRVCEALAAVYAAQGRIGEAEHAWLAALNMAQRIEAKSIIVEINWSYGQFLVQQGDRKRGIDLMAQCVAYEQQIGHAQAEEHAALVERLRAGGELPG
ncbi:MAG: hypothetical protein OHK0022_44890 [Roseiflexaceae bacterium]